MRDSVCAFVRRSWLVWGLTLAFGLGLLFGLLGGFWARPASQALLALVVLLSCLLLWGGRVRRVRPPRRAGLLVLGWLGILLLFLVPMVLMQVFPQTLLSCLAVGWVASLALGRPGSGRGWKMLLLAAALGCVAGLGLQSAYVSLLSGQAINTLLAGTMLLLSVLGGVLGGSARWLAAWWLGTASPNVASSSLIPHEEAAAASLATSQDGRLSRREVLAGMAGAVGLAATGGGLTWATRSLSSYFVLPLRTYRGHQEFIWSLSWSPDGTRIASVGNEVTESFQIWEAATGKTLLVAPAQPEANTVFAAWSPNGRWIAAQSAVELDLWQVASSTILASYAGVTLVSGWSPDSTRLVSRLESVIYEAATGRTLVTCQQPGFLAECAAWSPDGTRIASGGSQLDQAHPNMPPQNQAIIWDAASGQPLMVYYGHAQDQPYLPPNRVAWSPESTHVASASVDGGAIHVWQAATGQTVLIYRGHTAVVTALEWSPDGTRVASAGVDGTVQIWNPISGDCLFTYHGHNTAASPGGGGVTAMAWSPDGRVIASGDTHGTIQIWRPA